MGNKVLALYLDAPLQSWGHQSRFDRRTTLSFPTRSGLIGMFCAALGVPKQDLAGLARFDGIELTVLCYGGEHRLVDFHTVGGGYDDVLKRYRARKAKGPLKKDPVVTRREYLQGVRFGVLARGEIALLQEIADGLNDPVWGIWFGRKCCVPATPVVQGIFESAEAAEARFDELEAARPGEVKRPRKYVEVEDFSEGTDTILDQPLDFGARVYAPRRVAEK